MHVGTVEWCLVWWCMLVTVLLNASADAQQFSRSTVSYQPCRADSDCKINSFCFNNDATREGNCKCTEDHIMFRNRSSYECLPPAGLSSKCKFDEQCELVLGLDSQCGTKNTCECLPTAHYVAEMNSCYSTSRINETCISDRNCLMGNGQLARCTYGKCTCGLNEHVSNGMCVPSIHLGQQCNKDESCIHMNAYCRTVCECRVGYVVANDQSSCLEAAKSIGDNCEQLSQCTNMLKNSECSSTGLCDCEGGHHNYKGHCYKSRFVGESCEDRRECVRNEHLENSVDCINSLCTCKAGIDADSHKDCSKDNSYVDQRRSMQFIGLLAVIVIFSII